MTGVAEAAGREDPDMERQHTDARRPADATPVGVTTTAGIASFSTRRWRGAVTLLVSLAVAGAAAYGIVSIQDHSEKARESQFVLASLSAEKYHVLYLQEEATLQGHLSAETERELRSTLSAGQSKVAEVEKLDGHGDHSHLNAAYTAFRRGVESQIGALRGGDMDEAHRIEQALIYPAFEDLEDAVAVDLVEHGHEAERADEIADKGSIVALGLAALLISGVASLHRRAGRRTLRLAAEQGALHVSEQRFRSLVQHSSDMITVVDAHLVPIYNTPSVEAVLGYSDPELSAAASSAALVHPDDEPGVRARLQELVGEHHGHSALLAYRIMHRDGSWRHVETVATNLLGEPTIAGLVLNSRDVTDRAALEGQLTHRALHDPLTDLANRALFADRAEHALARAGRHSNHTAMALLDLDNFKAVNDSLGHAAGDELLLIVAARLEQCVRPGDTVARLGGDEFAVLLEETVEVESLGAADRMLEALRQPVVVAGRPIVINASIGVASSRDASDATTLMRNADLAMYAAKGHGKARTEVFHQGMHEAVQVRMELEADLRFALADALAAGQLRLHYQPKVSLVDGRITGMEALVRWEHPERGLVPPLEFIPLAEETGLIVPIGAWVLEEACRQSVAWQAEGDGDQPLVMSVNVSGRQFESDLVGTVARVLDTTGMEPSKLCLEVTESMVMKDVDVAVATLRDLKALGVMLSVDDFGTGYSSLSYLKQFPLDELKIDKSFVDGLGRDSEDGAIVAAVMNMARALELTVVAEGVETDSQATSLRALGCETAQGFYFSRPKVAADITELLVLEEVRRHKDATAAGRLPGGPTGTHPTRPVRFAKTPD